MVIITTTTITILIIMNDDDDDNDDGDAIGVDDIQTYNHHNEHYGATKIIIKNILETLTEKPFSINCICESLFHYFLFLLLLLWLFLCFV